jgi:hypothetical protein
MPVLREIHGNLATAVVLFNTLLALWGLWTYFRGGRSVDGNYAGALALSPVLGLVQMLIGLVLIAQTGSGGGARLVHYLYGVLVTINIPAAFALTRGRDDRGMLLIYAMVLLFTAACGLRAYSAVHGGGI